MRSKAACVEKPLLQDQTFGIGEVKELNHGIQRRSSLSRGHSVHNLRSEQEEGKQNDGELLKLDQVTETTE